MSEAPRRDPRAEWILRNRLHPEHDVLVAAHSGPTRGPTGLLRKNPHAVGFIGPQGIKRIDRSAGLSGGASGLSSGARGRSASTEVELPLHRVEHPDFYVAVVVDLVAGRLSSHDRDILGQARILAKGSEEQGAVVAVALGEAREANFEAAGADRLVSLTELQGQSLSGYCPEHKLAVLEAVEAELSPRFWLFPDSIHGGADLGSRLAARLGERPAVHAWKVDAQQTVCRGGSQLTDWHRPTARVLLLAEECALPVDETRHEARPIELASIPEVSALIEDLGQVDVDPSKIALGEAEFILSAGNGIRDWDQFHAVATALGATEGASRVAVDDGHMPRNRQVGATGTWVTARVYVAIGISGAIQHLQGIGQCDKVVAINLDDSCDMIKRADLSVIGDSQAILGELLRLAEARQGGTGDAAIDLTEEARHVA
ncbi:electron transfer flavoprotein subunit alpha/FixB family protein [Marinobacter halodurans]|uniref:Electron transfer flavoprotein subunit alpha/FixB family protein n=1 Tax=Marinobacter halodurans TaxID=2528979 RepID=A0ABY1ZK16_9GAMM|nr:electron transfer flavoprotein subunit alpha/FixB family protein [Marinobacter halodurans]TBW55749.1 electron transfer flavoprotein subunit alpha/FixB family protein [Marinobacter halodurans]